MGNRSWNTSVLGVIEPGTLYWSWDTEINVFKKSEHILDGNCLELTLYLERLGLSGGSKDPDNFPVPKSFSLKDVSQSQLLFLQKCPAFWQEFMAKLK